jgi:chromosome segregation ATPase
MDFKDIDAMIEAAARRLEGGVSPTAGYGEPPLASDHFLLRRSWEFFQKRIRAMEEQWEEIARAKDAEIKALLKSAEQDRARLTDLESKASEMDEIERMLEHVRLDERREFETSIRALKEKWELQRENLERQVADSELRETRIRKEAESRLAAFDREAKELRASLEKARAEIHAQSEKRMEGEGVAAESLQQRDEVIRSLESKVELLKSELDRRDVMFRQTVERLQALAHDHERTSAEAAALKGQLSDARRGHEQLEAKLSDARREIESLQAARREEQAEWRELWDRAREMWEKERRDGRRGDSPSENR